MREADTRRQTEILLQESGRLSAISTSILTALARGFKVILLE